jgi:hypothetical protein
MTQRLEEFSSPTDDPVRRKQLFDDLLQLEQAVDVFLDGEIAMGQITSYKLVIITTVRTMRAVAMTARQDLVDNRVDLG